MGPLMALMESAGQNGSKIVRQTPHDPVLYLDRLAAIFRHVTIELEPGQAHPAAHLAIQEVWPVISQTFNVYAQDTRIMERTCRTLRFVIRCLGTQSSPLVEPLVKLLVSLYIVQPHSCFLYLVSTYRSRQCNESKVLHNTEVIRFSTADICLKIYYFYSNS